MKWTRPLCRPAAMNQNDCQTSETVQPQEASPVQHHMSVLGIDIAKRSYHVVGMNERGAHDWTQRFRARHHAVKRMAPPLVKPYGAT
jgi:hypothetical protein